MGHNNMVSGHPISTGILRVDGLSTGLSDFGCHKTSILILLFIIWKVDFG